ncbi:MAG: carboxypeptidase-like regulatory domain-containing protein, partial [Massilibacteroides sp.]|nr:carboxypeptidase-like regulatory domain-containing protein [Massilibacteroides sp.]
MRCFIVLFIISTLQSFASVTYSQSAKLSLNMNNTTVREVLNKIETQSKFYFTYSTNEVQTDRTLSIKVNHKNIDSILSQVFKETNVGYKIDGKHVVLFHKTKNETATGQQDTKTIKGKIVDNDGIPIIGANVIVKGTTNGTITDLDGNFSLLINSDAILNVSYIGYVSIDVNTANKSNLDLVLREDSQALDEVVVIGYGVQKKKLVTGATVQVKGDDLEKMNSTS